MFVNSINKARQLCRVLQLLRLPVYALHAQMQQRQRLKNLDRFKATANGIVVVRSDA